MAAKVHPTALQPLPLAINGTRNAETSASVQPAPDEILTINVAGEKFQTFASTLARFPNSLLGDPKKRRQFWNADRREFFIDRHRQSFESILYIYQSFGHVIRPESIPLFNYLAELKFYEASFDSAVMASFWENEVREVNEKGFSQPEAEEEMPKNAVQRAVWKFIEYPDSSLGARMLGVFSIFMIVTSCVSFCLETMPIFEDLNKSKQWTSPFFVVELVCSAWFLLEFSIRFLSSPSKLAFIKTVGNILDLSSTLRISLVSEDSHDGSFSVLRAIRLIRVIQVFKLSRHVIGLRVLGQTFKASLQEVILMGFFLLIALILFSSCIYFAENSQPDSKFNSIPGSSWFVLATITTVGFGDVVPTTVQGQVIGSICALVGVMTLTFPISIIITNFKQFYKQAFRLAALQPEDLQLATQQMKDWREEAKSGNRNGGPPELFRRGVAPLHWLGARGGSMDSADDALYV
ncbi:Potassium voltage-gated channel protein Shaker [Aphelenchoides fujianensis]|nr:Potassium voltage-gated channel protein Shaker [Aphelenchoides fujianensis]